VYLQFSFGRKNLKFIAIPKILSRTGNGDVTEKILCCSASLQQMTTLLMPLVSSGVLFCDPKTSSPQIQLWIQPDLSFLNLAKSGSRRI